MSFDLNDLDEHLFNYGDLNDEHKKAAKEFLRLLDQHNDPLIVAELIKKNFGLKPKPQVKPEESLFVQACAKSGQYVNIQGHVEDDGVLYPVCSITDDIRKLDKLFGIIKDFEVK
jgi:hypothetical protein